MPLVLPECKMTLLCGPISSGKTFLLKQFIENNNRHVIFDSTGEYLNEDTGDNRLEIWKSPRTVYDTIKANPYLYRIVYVPGRDREEDFYHVLNAMWWIPVDKLLVCDEVADICPVDSLDENIEMLLRFARKDKMGFLTATQRIADVHKLFTGGCRMVVLFQTNEARDLDAINSRWKCAEMVANLRPLLYDDDTETVQQIPQAVVIMKGKKPYVYDFESDSEETDSVPDLAPNGEGSETPIDEIEGKSTGTEELQESNQT